MHLQSLAALLILQCCVPLAVTASGQYTDASSYSTVGTIAFRGSRLRVYEIDGVRVAEPRVGYAGTCGTLQYSNLYLKYQLAIPIRIEVDTLKTSSDRSKKVGRIRLTELGVVADKALASRDARVTAMVRLRSSGHGALILMCNTFNRCRDLRDGVLANPKELLDAVSFVPIGMVGGTKVRFGAQKGASEPRIGYCNHNRWIVFQRRVDGSLSFARNWNAYVRGFGNPRSNYWMGLNQLFAMTATTEKNGYSDSSRCRLRIETEDFFGKRYWSEFGLFEVLSPQENYRLRVGKMVRGSMIKMDAHNGMQFSTYDRDHDRTGGSCSRHYGYGGWWYNACHVTNLNGAYTTDRSIRNHPNYDSVAYGGKYIPMKKTLMKFRCS